MHHTTVRARPAGRKLVGAIVSLVMAAVALTACSAANPGASAESETPETTGVDVIFVRHGEAKPSQGPLSELGLQQVAELATTLQDEPVIAVYSSMMTRAFQTGAAVAESHDLPLLADSRLNEVDLNEGLSDADKGVEILRRMAAWLDGEDREMMYSAEGDYNVLNDRFHAWWPEFVADFRQEEGTVVVAAHFATLSLMLPTICEGADLTADFILNEHPLANTSMIRTHLNAGGSLTCEEWDGAPIPTS